MLFDLRFLLTAFGIVFAFQAQAGVPVSRFDVDNMRFSRACAPASDQITIGGVGDLLMHGPVQAQARDAGSFSRLWETLLPVFNQAEVMYANLETPLAAGLTARQRLVRDPGGFDNHVYTGYPLFNTSPRLAYDLVQSGFDVVSTANNHSLDRGSRGADMTLDALEDAGLAYTGTRRSNEPTAAWFTYVHQRGWNLAFLACTFSTNGIRDRHDQVLDCFKDTEELLGLVRSLSRTRGVDAVIVTPHWGWTEYVSEPDRQNVELGRSLIEAGATAVIGTHPHVVQPWEKYTSSDGREGLIVYSTGNFISNQSAWAKRLGLSVFLGLSKDRQGRVWINGVRYHPLFTGFRPSRVESLPRTDSSLRHVWNSLTHLVGEDRYLDSSERLLTNYECF